MVGGAELFFAGLLGAASRFRVPAFAVTVLISGLEVENLAAGIATNAKGLPGAAAGTFLGGTTFLALGVSGIAAVIAPLDARLPRRALGWTAVSPIPLLILGLDGRLSRLDGVLLVAWFAVSLAGLAMTSPPAKAPPPSPPRRALLRLAGGLAALTAGGELLGEGIRHTVERVGVSQTLLGNTAVAASVEAEEIGRVVVPARHGRGDLALANVTGTVVHFVGLNAGVIALVKPLRLDHDTLHLHLPAAVAATLGLCALLAWRHGISRPAGGILIGLYGAYVAISIAVAAG